MSSIKKSADTKNTYTIGINFLAKYLSLGVVNTIVGFSIIYLAMRFGLSPVISNFLGYGFGLVFSFIFSKKIVFLTEKNIAKEAFYYLISFAISFSINIFVLQLIIYFTHIQLVFAQFFSIASYSLAMYLLCKFFVFRPELKN